jgi:hypothetical protein
MSWIEFNIRGDQNEKTIIAIIKSVSIIGAGARYYGEYGAG